jgi:uncharacterized protein YbjT (DUF2867 family)
MSKIVVIGGTGTVGSQTVQELMKRGAEVRVMTRSASRIASLPKGVEGVTGSMLKPESLPAVFAGADKLFLITPLDRDETAQGIDAVDAAVAAGIRRIVYLSVHHADKALTIPHFVSKLPVEGVIRASGVEHTILRPNNFFQNDLAVLDAIRAGVYPQPSGSVGMHRVDVRDIAEAAAIALTQPGHSGKIYSVVGPRAWTGAEIAATLTRHLGKSRLAAFERSGLVLVSNCNYHRPDVRYGPVQLLGKTALSPRVSIQSVGSIRLVQRPRHLVHFVET